MAPVNPFQLPFPKAIKYFKKLVPLPSEKWTDITEQYRSVAWAIAGITKTAILKDLQDAIAGALESGISPEKFREQFAGIAIRRGWNSQFSPYRINLIYSQSIRTAYNYGRFEQLTDPSTLKPYWQWRWRDSAQPREHHRSQDNKVFPANDECFKAIMPQPFGCRCTVYALSDRQMKKEGLSLSKPPKLASIAEPSFTKGFPASLTEQRTQLVERAIASLPPNLAALLKEDVDFGEQLRDARGRWARTGGTKNLAPPIDPGSTTKNSLNKEEKKRARLLQKKNDEKERLAIALLQSEKASAAFDDAPELIKKALTKYGRPEIIPPIESASAFCIIGGNIHMDKTPDDYFAAVYRHEWGHYADHEIGKKLNSSADKKVYASSSPEGKKAFRLDEKAFSPERLQAAIESLPMEPEAAVIIADIAGCLTKNKYGFGHSDEYVAVPENRRTEVFANIISLVGSGKKEYMRPAVILAPNTFDFVMSKLNE